MALTGLTATSPQRSAIAQTQASVVEPNEAAKARLQNIVKGILAAWDKADVVCLGEDHGGKNDSDLRIALVEHPDFVRKVNVIIVESANAAHQDILDRFILEGEDHTRTYWIVSFLKVKTCLATDCAWSGAMPTEQKSGSHQFTKHFCEPCGEVISQCPGNSACA